MIDKDIEQNKYYPPFITPWVFSDEFINRLGKIKARHGIYQEKEDVFANFIFDMMTDRINYDELSQIVKSLFFFNKEETARFIKDVVGWLMLPVMPFYEYDFVELLEKNGGKPSEYPFPGSMADILEEMQIRLEDEAWELKAKFLHEVIEEERSKEKPEELKQEDLHFSQEQLKEIYKNILTPEIEKQREVLHKKYDQDSDDFTKIFYESINNRDSSGVIAALWVLAQRGKLLYLLVDDKKISGLLLKHLENKFGIEVADHFAEDKGRIAYLAYFLKHLLVDTLKINESDSAALVVHLFNEQKNISGDIPDVIAFGDVQTKKFMWRDIIADNGELVLK